MDEWHLILNRPAGRAEVRPGQGDPKRRWCWGGKGDMIKVALGHVAQVSVYDGPGWPRIVTE